MTGKQIRHMVERFLTWKLPENFHPDAGIKFEPVVNLGTEHQYRHEPVGTNLFDYTQAEQMVRHMLDGLPDHTDKIAARMGARFEDRHGTRKSEAPADDAGGGPHEWGYRDPVTGDFIADDWPFRAADALGAKDHIIERLEAEVERLEGLVHVPGVWRCAKCEFTLIQSVLNAEDGSVTARDEPGDKCPNDGSPLWRVSYRDWVLENEKGWTELLDRKDAELAALKEQTP